MEKAEFLLAKTEQIRRDLIVNAIANGAGHIAPSLSCVDILCALYYGVMNFDPADPYWEDRDRLIFSKSHGCYGLYAILADLGRLPREKWERFYAQGSDLSGCVERNMEYGIEAGCGSLGHGLPLAVGVAFGAKLQRKNFHTFCVIGDGEMQEGTTWEALLFAVKHGLGNLTLIVDQNGLQAMEFIGNILDKEKGDLVRRLIGFGLHPKGCPGHEVMALVRCLSEMRSIPGAVPHVLMAETVKGYGLKCMESVPKFHFRVPGCGQLG